MAKAKQKGEEASDEDSDEDSVKDEEFDAFLGKLFSGFYILYSFIYVCNICYV